jgi:hypothetical protein
MTRGTIRQLAAATVVAAGTLGVGLSAGTHEASAHSVIATAFFHRCLIDPYICIKRLVPQPYGEPIDPYIAITQALEHTPAGRGAGSQKDTLLVAGASNWALPAAGSAQVTILWHEPYH